MTIKIADERLEELPFGLRDLARDVGDEDAPSRPCPVNPAPIFLVLPSPGTLTHKRGPAAAKLSLRRVEERRQFGRGLSARHDLDDFHLCPPRLVCPSDPDGTSLL